MSMFVMKQEKKKKISDTEKTQASWKHEHAGWKYLKSFTCCESGTTQLSPMSLSNLQIGGLLRCPFSLSLLFWKNKTKQKKPSLSVFLSVCFSSLWCVLVSKITVLMHMSRIPVRSWNASNARRTDHSTAASTDTSFDVFEREWWREGERKQCVYFRKRERKKRSEKHMDGWTEAWTGMCAKQQQTYGEIK